jgi:hypothetical protein
MLSGNNRVREDVLDASLDEHVAPSLGGVVTGNEHKIYTDPEEFFRRTLITESMINLLENIANVVSEGKGNKVIMLSAFFGGGKTHTLIALYHVIRKPEALNVVLQRQGEPEDVKKRVRDVIEKLEKVKDEVSIIVIDGSLSALSPSPIDPRKVEVGAYEVNTLWGYIAQALGSYDYFKRFDQALAPPKVDDITNLLSHRRLVIIVDEIAQYIESLYNANDDKLRNYAKNVVIFFESLAKAVAALTNTVLVISLPVRFGSGGAIETQSIYKGSDVVYGLTEAIGRVSAAPLEPVKPNEIPVLLRIRLFEKIDHARAKEVAEILEQEYDRNKNVFGQVDSKLIMRVRETYPFHPLYVDTLLDILDKHEGLQKTRDLLRISRKVVRAVVGDKQNVYDLIMPWHIDVEMDDIRNLLLAPNYESFRLPIEEDIIKRCNSYVKPWIAKIVAKALFIKTFVYGGGIVPKPEFFPTSEELAVLTYEPGLFSSKNAQPKDVAETIDWVPSNLLYVLKDEKTQRLWFTVMMSPVKFIEDRAQKVQEAEVYNKILEAVNDLLKEPPENIIEKKRKKDERDKIKVFDVEESRASRECKPIDHDAKKYIVYACLELDVTRKDEILQEVIYNTSSGGMRKYANTIYVVYPEQRESLLPAENYAKKTIACEQVSKEDLDSLLPKGIGGQEVEMARAVYRSKIDSYCSNAAQSFYYSVISALSKLAYPVQKDTIRTKAEVDMPVKTTSIIFAVEQALSREGSKKVRLDLGFDTLDFLLKSISVDLNSAARKVSDIIDYFYSNPKLPAVPEKAIRDAIAEGVRNLDIGLRCDNRVYYKHVVACETEEKCLEAMKVEGEPITDRAVDDTCEVLPYTEAVKAQMERLERREWYEGEAKVVEDYYMVLDGKLVSVRDIVASFDEYVNEYGPDTLREAPLVSVRRRVIVDVTPKEYELEVKPGEKIEHKLVVSRSGPFKGTLHVEANYGEVSPSDLNVDERFTESPVTWTIEAPTEPGKYSYVLELVTEDGKRVASAKLSVVVGLGTVEKEWYEGVPPQGTEIEDMKLVIKQRDLRPLNVLKNRLATSVIAKNVNLNLNAKTIENREVKVNLEISNVKLDDVLAILTPIIERFGLAEIEEMNITLEIVPIDSRSFKMPTLSEDDLSALSKHKVEYKPVKK